MPRPLLFLLLSTLCLPLSAASAAPPQLWFYQSTNFLVDQDLRDMEKVWRRAAAAGYSHVMLSDYRFATLSNLGSDEPHYLANVQHCLKLAADLKLQIVPCVFSIGYANDLLSLDPNLAEGLPVRDQLFITDSTGHAHLTPDPPVSFDERNIYKYPDVHLDAGLATVDNPKAAALLSYQVHVAPFRCYHVSVLIRTQGFTAQPEIKAVAPGSKDLQFQTLSVAATQDWTRYDVIFNSLDNQQVNVYFCVWPGAAGRLQWKDWKIQEVGLLNILHRPGTPCIVKDESTGRTLTPGRDYDPPTDPRLGCVPYQGRYEPWHEPPSLQTHLPPATRLRISWYHPAVIYDGQVSCCLSEPRTMQLEADSARHLRQLFSSAGYMMTADELRVMNWDQSCQEQHLDAGPLLAQNARACAHLLAGSQVYVWSDMFDPFHNAHKDYYLVHGDLTGSWEGLDKDVIIVNWNFAHRDDSLKFFAARGHRQVIAAYYDSPADTPAWLHSAARVSGIVGIMYTTWQHHYDDLESFAAQVRQP